jgi:glycerol uptake facilitator-like aquaporin
MSARPRSLAAEFLGTAMLLAVVIGSGIMAEQLAGGNVAVALLANAFATALGLYVLIAVFGPVSGAHFNPAVTLVAVHQRLLPRGLALPYIAAQCAGAIAGTLLAHAMFDLPLLQVSGHARAGVGQFVSEIVATFGLVLTILALVRTNPAAVAPAVAAYIGAAYWFTASTSFANPAVTLARSLTDTFAGIRPLDVLLFVPAQLLGAFAAVAVFRWLMAPDPRVQQSDAARAPAESSVR